MLWLAPCRCTVSPASAPGQIAGPTSARQDRTPETHKRTKTKYIHTNIAPHTQRVYVPTSPPPIAYKTKRRLPHHVIPPHNARLVCQPAVAVPVVVPKLCHEIAVAAAVSGGGELALDALKLLRQLGGFMGAC